MASDPTLTLTSSNSSAATRLEGAMNSNTTTRQSSRLARLGHILTGACALVAAIATAGNTNVVRLLESGTQSLFFQLRGPVAPPDNIVILAIDNESLKQAENYRAAPQQYGYLEPLQTWPWKRAAYAKAIDQIMAAGARSVALNLVFDQPSRYGAADDELLRQVLQRYKGKVTLAALYEDVQMRQGSVQQLTQPHRQFWTKPISVGSINYPLEADGGIYRFASEYRKLLNQTSPNKVASEFKGVTVATPSFEQAALTAAGLNASQDKGDRIYFYGPSGTFEQVPFWYVLDPVNWNGYLQQGKYFKDKIVLIGPTATELKDFYKAPFSQSWLYPEPLSGIEIHANAIASKLTGKAIRDALPYAPLRGLLVLMGTVGAGVWLSKQKRSLTRAGWTIGIIIAWGGMSYLAFAYGQLILPTAMPIVAIALGGFSYLTTGSVSEQIKKRQLRQTLALHATSPVIQEIISQHDEFQDLLPTLPTPLTIPVPANTPVPASTPAPASTQKTIGGRYQIVKVLGAGGFGETYIAQDTQRPGKPQCVVKQLRPAFKDAKHLKLARRLFQLEAEVLERLGQHKQIPTLLAYFEEGEEFYLVQEFINGHPLDEELLIGRQIPESDAIEMMLEILEILEFVHAQNVIHRDIKPGNIIKRHADNKLVLIDFGAVKEINTQLMMEGEGQSRFTVGIGTQGYALNEQCAGRPRFNSDIYAVGMMGIQALTGLPPSQLPQDSETGEILWAFKTQASQELIEALNKMVCYDFRQRYQTVLEVKAALLKLNQNFSTQSVFPEELPAEETIFIPQSEKFDDPTEPWSETE